MDDIQIILYIIFAVIAILSQAFKKKKQQANTPPRVDNDDTHNRKPQPQSFEDLLKEFTGEKKSQERSEWQEAQPVSDYGLDDDEIQQVYESSVRDAKDLKTIDELVDLKDDRHTGSFQHFRGYDEHEKEKEPNEFIEMLQDTEGAKKAIILGEIMNRKY